MKGGFKEEKSNSFIDPAGFLQRAAVMAFAQGLQKYLKERPSSCGVQPKQCLPSAPPAVEMWTSGVTWPEKEMLFWAVLGFPYLSKSYSFLWPAFNGDLCLTRIPSLCCKMVLLENL